MSHVLTLKLETSSPERRDDLINTIIAALDAQMRAGDKVVFTLAHETPQYRGKELRKRWVEWESGEDPPTLYDFGIFGTQREMFADEQLREQTAPLGNGVAPAESSVAVADDEPEAEQPAEPDLSAAERLLADALDEQPENDDEDDETD